MNTSNTAVRLIAACTAVVMTTLIVGSQLGLASHYTALADQAMAQAHPTVVAQRAASATPRRPI